MNNDCDRNPPAFFLIDILPRRCICTTRVESRASQTESTKTIAFPIQSVDPTSLFPCAGEDQDICRVGIAHQPFSLLISCPAAAFAQPASKAAIRRWNPPRLSPSLSSQLIPPAFFPIDNQTRAIEIPSSPLRWIRSHMRIRRG